MYGVLDNNGCHTDVSMSEIGAKRYATAHGYNKVSVRYNGSLYVDTIAEKSEVTGKWIAVNDPLGKVQCFKK